ncbi:MAG: hypothetical protein U9R75_07000, partial [Candidatus Thermoplasmatota archaeon]|nr:hypothetical protein [Candidatus Thermoplasmatota archaeon]
RVSFHYPDHLSGQVDLHLVICGKRHDLGEFKVRDGDKIDLQSVRFVPDTVSPGSFSTLVIRYDVGDGAGDDLGGVLEIEGMDPPRLDFSISSSENVKEIEVRIPDRTIVGKMSPILTLRSGVETISRSVLSGTLEVRDESFMGIDLVVPGDIARCEDGFPFSGYLFPGEKIEKRTSIGDFDRYITSTGRNIFVYDGSVVYGNGWKGDYDRIRSRMMLMEILALFENPRSLRELEEANDDLGRLHHSALEGDRDKGGSWYGSGIKLGDDTRAGVISGPVLTHWSDGKQRLMTASGSRNDPLRLLSYHLKGFLEGNKGTSAITDHLEKLIKDLRSSTPISDLDRIRKASLISEREIRRSLRSILKGGVKVETVRNLLLNLMISHLTRTEALTSWNDEYVNSWNILGIERKRGIKSELSSLFELLDELDDAQKRVNARHNSYRKNMEVRRTLDAVSRVRVSGSSVRPGGVPGTPWRAKIVFEGLVKDGGGKVMPLIKLPGPGWNLVDTMASREGNVFRLDEVDTLSGNIDLELVVSSPVTASGQNNALVYLMPSRYEMEVEP